METESETREWSEEETTPRVNPLASPGWSLLNFCTGRHTQVPLSDHESCPSEQAQALSLMGLSYPSLSSPAWTLHSPFRIVGVHREASPLAEGAGTLTWGWDLFGWLLFFNLCCFLFFVCGCAGSSCCVSSFTNAFLILSPAGRVKAYNQKATIEYRLLIHSACLFLCVFKRLRTVTLNKTRRQGYYF